MSEDSICTNAGFTVSHSSWDKNSIGVSQRGSMHGEVKVWTKKEIAEFNKERKGK